VHGSVGRRIENLYDQIWLLIALTWTGHTHSAKVRACVFVMDQIAPVDQFVQLPHALLDRLCRSIDDLISMREGQVIPLPAKVIQDARKAVEDGMYCFVFSFQI
jgi:hypothetical protein